MIITFHDDTEGGDQRKRRYLVLSVICCGSIQARCKSRLRSADNKADSCWEARRTSLLTTMRSGEQLPTFHSDQGGRVDKCALIGFRQLSRHLECCGLGDKEERRFSGEAECGARRCCGGAVTLLHNGCPWLVAGSVIGLAGPRRTNRSRGTCTSSIQLLPAPTPHLLFLASHLHHQSNRRTRPHYLHHVDYRPRQEHRQRYHRDSSP